MSSKSHFGGTDQGAKAWDHIVISGEQFLGLAQVTAKVENRIDKKPAAGKHGAVIRFQGYEPGEISITLRAWTEPLYDAMLQIITRLRPRKGQAPTAIDVTHPALTALDISSVYVKEISSPEERDRGVWEVKISALEFFDVKDGKNVSKKPGADQRSDIRANDPSFVGDAPPTPPSQNPAALAP
jgi:hypothetical protein